MASDDRMINNDIIGFKETHISPQDSICKIMETLSFFNIDFNINEKQYLSFAYRCRNDVVILDTFNAFADRAFTLMLRL